MDRRGFISNLFKSVTAMVAAPVVAIASPAIWVPPKQIVAPNAELKIVQSLVSDGQVVYGYILRPDSLSVVDLEELSDDALRHFPAGNPVLILSNVKNDDIRRHARRFVRFMFRGSKEQALSHIKAEVIGGFESAAAFGWMASNGD